MFRIRARALGHALIPLAAIWLGAGIAAAQLLPAFELAQASARGGGVSEAFFTEFSYSPALLALLLHPFLLGNPYPRVSVEVVAYLGALPLLLASVAIFFRRNRATLFWLLLAVGALTLAFGGFTPFYRYLRFIPVLNFFRVPARFLFPFALAVSMLSGIGFDVLLARARESGFPRNARIVGALFGATIAGVIGLATLVEVDAWIAAWRALPFIFFASGLFILLRGGRGGFNRALLATLVLGLSLADLAAFGAVYVQTFNVIAPRAEIFSTPRVLADLALSDGARVLTSESVYPWLSVMRESLYPNLNAAYRVPALGGYTPLVPRRMQLVLDHLTPALLNLFGVRYYLVPQVLPVDPASEQADLADPFALKLSEHAIEIQPTEASGLLIDSSLAQSVELHDGDVVANFVLTLDNGQTITVPLRAGFDTGEWAYERSDVRRVVQHSEPPIATTFPARSAFPIEAHPGHTFRAQRPFSVAPVNVVRIALEPKIPAGLIHIERVVLTDGDTHTDLAALVGKASHRLIYRSEDVAVYENASGAPRAFVTHSALVVNDETALARLQAPDYSGELLLADGEELQNDVGEGIDEQAEIISYEPERVVLNVNASFDGYVVLADAWDAGWTAVVDGQPATVQRADLVLRAVRIAGGQHRVEFLYRPRSFYIGAVISIVSLLALVLIPFNLWLFARRAH